MCDLVNACLERNEIMRNIEAREHQYPFCLSSLLMPSYLVMLVLISTVNLFQAKAFFYNDSNN